ncbi:cytosine permease [Actinocrispum wychmicini]|uniref:Purine-cytosine permease-like protein n=1 Tax=Actinocrispum wychmicini TaxID=1213861 RepID=A0A4R2JAX5_9PSEU|nr:cytosine permease [Actinocrispum wychmicini]TCO55032.1 purine-cytosine permease-like protein [Actinocrispum wychmicini]
MTATSSTSPSSTGQELVIGLSHDYSTSDAGEVPLSQRRSLYHFTALWITLAAGFTYLFLGFQYHDAGYSLWRAVGAGAVGAVAYLLYALPAAYLGSTTGLTHSLLTRSIFGKIGSVVVSLILIGVAAGWTAFAFNLLATLYDGLFSWGNVVLISVVLAVVGVTNNVFGFGGIAAFARYLVAPLMILWMVYLLVKGIATVPGAVMGAGTSDNLPFLSGVGLAIGAVMWGNEPDTWRYGKPRFFWPTLPLVVAFAIGLVLFVAGGWLMGALSGVGQYDIGPAFRYSVEYSLFGALWLGAIVATVLQIAINDGNYYEMINAGQNLFGQAKGWRRLYTCLLMAGVAAVFTWWFPHLQNGFFSIAGWTSIALPSATVVMCVDKFVLPRLSPVERPAAVPSWRAAGLANWPAIAAVLVAVLFGAWGLGLLPGQGSTPSLGLVPVEAWLIAGLVYLLLGTVAARSSGARTLLGFASADVDG